ncbi:hypothetical protein HLK59_05505 [Streptomyces sp. S3(2020)]|uniref:hypothetical protein n=1 Tax=Streptomyces sp. S3(2020) TaxID=2732044 RepID=UPI0014893336|nr:hypothetical protein [Streptomyces sp. S3(2020)]NNN29823.1 hypothetical protein [Streptomyces sp. S3(2020)]
MPDIVTGMLSRGRKVGTTAVPAAGLAADGPAHEPLGADDRTPHAVGSGRHMSTTSDTTERTRA